MSEFKFPPFKLANDDNPGKCPICRRQDGEPIAKAQQKTLGGFTVHSTEGLVGRRSLRRCAQEAKRSGALIQAGPLIPRPGPAQISPWQMNPAPYHGILGRMKWKGASEPNDERVLVDVTGHPASLMVRITEPLNGEDVILGTGALIGPRHILTAAHVVWELKNKVYNAIFEVERWGSNMKVPHSGIKNVIVDTDFQFNAKQGKFKNLSNLPELFCGTDIAVVVTYENLIDPSTEFFSVFAPSGTSWWANRVMKTMGFPRRDQPCFTAGPPDVDFFPHPFKYCTGGLMAQTVKYPGIGYNYDGSTTGCVRSFFDMRVGQSGSPVYDDSLNIYGLLCYTDTILGRNFAHQISQQNDVDIGAILTTY